MARRVHELIEEQARRWRFAQQQSTAQQAQLPNVVTISHALKSRGAQIAARLGELLDIPVYEREIVAYIAATADVHLETVQTLDQRVQGRIDEYMSALFHERNFDRSDYLRLVTRTVLALWQHGPAVLCGRGCVHIVPAAHALAIRLTAPEEIRVHRLAQDDGLDLHEARRQIRRVDAEREAYHRRFFGAAIEDSRHYDLILNTGRSDVDRCAAMIAAAYRCKFTRAREAGEQV